MTAAAGRVAASRVPAIRLADVSKAYREGDRLYAEFTEERGAVAREVRVPLVMSTGSHHMQVYWYPTGEGNLLDQFPLVWLREADRWVPRNAAFIRPPSDHPPSELGRWNSKCINCHTTRGRPRMRPPCFAWRTQAESPVAPPPIFSPSTGIP